MSAISSSPFQLLEINMISAQDLVPVSKSIRAYAVAWLHPERKLATQIDEVGHTNPTWNEKFVFRVDEEFLNSEKSVIMIDIYTSAWLRDILIGTVAVQITNLLPPSVRSGNRKSKLRFVTLQIRRPSGRPQGILNIGVTLLDNTMRSMPMYSELSTSDVGYWDTMESKKNKKKKKHNANEDHESVEFDQSENNSAFDPKLLTLQRCQSEKNDSSLNDYNSSYNGAGKNYYEFDGNGSEVGVTGKGFGIVNNANESVCNSDVGPSPSLVAAAIAKGLYPMPMISLQSGESSAIDEWSENNRTEGMKTKIERWKNEVPPVYDDLDSDIKNIENIKKQSSKHNNGSGKQRRGNNNNNGLCSCFGTVFGCEISITCGGAGKRKKKGGGGVGKGRVTNASEITYDQSYVS